MSDEEKTTTPLTTEHNNQVQQESSQSSDKDSVVESEDEPKESSDSVATQGSSGEAVFVENSCTQLTLQESGADVKDSEKSLISAGGSGTESQPVDAAAVGTESQPVDAAAVGTESQPVDAAAVCAESQPVDAATVGAESKAVDAVAESQSDDAIGTESQLLYVANGSSREDLEDSSSGDYDSRHSRETAVVGDTTSQASIESGAAGDISNVPSSQEYMAGSNGSGRFPAQDGREQAIQEVMIGFTEMCGICICICEFLKPCSRRIQKSTIFKFIYRTSLVVIGLLALSIGLSGMHTCPVKKQVPILMILMGITNFAILFTDWDIRNMFYPNAHTSLLRMGSLVARLAFLVLFLMMMGYTFTMHPSFDPKDLKNYCRVQFYYFAYYVNFAIAPVTILAILAFVPTMMERWNDYEEL